MAKKDKLMILAFSAVPFIMVLGNSMLIPEFPQIKKALDISQFRVGLLITTFSITAGITIPFLGYLSDQIGRKKVVVPSLIIYGLGGVICGSAAILLENPYKIILVGRAVQGLGAAGTAPIVMAWIGDIFQSEKRSEVLGIIEAANGVGKVTSPILGSIVGLISWVALFFFYAILSIPIAAGVYIWGEEGEINNSGNFKKYLQQIKKILKEKGLSLLSTILAGMLVLFILFGLLSYFSDILETDFKIKGVVKGLVIALPILFMSITSYINGVVLKKINKYFKIAINIGLAAVLFSLVGLNFFNQQLTAYLILFSIIGIGTGLVLPAVNTLVTSSTKSEQRGIVTSVYGSARFIGVALGPPAFSFMEGLSLPTMYLGGSAITFVVLIVTFIFIKEKGMKPPEKSS